LKGPTTVTDPTTTPYHYPWALASDGVAADFALADLTNNLPRQLTVDGKLHTATLLAASGAIAGFSAQRALLSQMAPDAVTPANGFHAVTTTSGGMFIYGEPLDYTLLPRSPTDMDKLWAHVTGAAVTAGLDPTDVPPVAPMFAHVAKTLGSPEEGNCSLADCRYMAPLLGVLQAVWPFALMCFNGRISAQAANAQAVVSQRWRPIIAAVAAGRMIRDAAPKMRPLKALTIVMESAIYASKLAPAMVEVLPVSGGTPQSPRGGPVRR
jgi:hypothetical protein